MTYKTVEIQVENNSDIDTWFEVYVCESCGSVVTNTELHDDWHGHVKHFAERAQHADIMLTPIGPGHQLPDQEFVDKQMEDWFGKIE